jgi:hypothetical protein
MGRNIDQPRLNPASAGFAHGGAKAQGSAIRPPAVGLRFSKLD